MCVNVHRFFNFSAAIMKLWLLSRRSILNLINCSNLFSTWLVSASLTLLGKFLYGQRFLNKISLVWPAYLLTEENFVVMHLHIKEN